MNKRGLIEQVASELKCTNVEAERSVNTFIAAVKRGLKKEGEVALFGFGSFTVRKRAARKGRNPQTGEPIDIKASKTVGFRAGKALRAGI